MPGFEQGQGQEEGQEQEQEQVFQPYAFEGLYKAATEKIAAFEATLSDSERKLFRTKSREGQSASKTYEQLSIEQKLHYARALFEEDIKKGTCLGPFGALLSADEADKLPAGIRRGIEKFDAADAALVQGDAAAAEGILGDILQCSHIHQGSAAVYKEGRLPGGGGGAAHCDVQFFFGARVAQMFEGNLRRITHTADLAKELLKLVHDRGLPLELVMRMVKFM